MASTGGISPELFPSCLNSCALHDTATLSFQLSPKASCGGAEIKWYKENDYICLYRNAKVRVATSYKGRLDILTKELGAGKISLILRDMRESDTGNYMCEVIHGDIPIRGVLRINYSSYSKRFAIYPILGGTYDEDEIMREYAKNHGGWSEVLKKMEENDLEIQTLTKSMERYKEDIKNLQDEREKDHKEIERLHRDLEQLRQQCHDARTRRTSMDLYQPDLSEDQTSEAASQTPAGPKPELRLVLLGRNAAEKKAARDAILGKAAVSSETSAKSEAVSGETCASSENSESQEESVGDRRVNVVLTPNWFSPEVHQGKLRDDVALCMQLSAPGPHAFILVIPVEDVTVGAGALTEDFENLFAGTSWKHTLILFTCREEISEETMEEKLTTGCQELMKVVEKCGHRWHLLNVSKNYSSEVEGLLRKIDDLADHNETDSFYNSETYLEAENQLREMERMIQKEREERREREERERIKQHEEELQECVRVMEEKIQEKDEKIEALEIKIVDLERELEEERNEERRQELERQLKEESEQRAETERERQRLREEMEREKREKEETHRKEIEEMQENYGREALAEAECNLMKIILPELQRNLMLSTAKMQGEFNRQLEEKNNEIKRLKEMLTKKQIETEIEEQGGLRQTLSAGMNWAMRNKPGWLP